MGKKKDVYSLFDKGWGDLQIRVNDETEIHIVAVLPLSGNGQYSTEQTRRQAFKRARKIVRVLNNED